MTRFFASGTSMVRWIAAGATLWMVGCASSELTPKQRYMEALNQRMEGNAEAYQDALIAIAHEAPDTRAGRRARATMLSSWFTNAAVLGAAGAFVLEAMSGSLEASLPNLLPSMGEGPRAELDALVHAQRQFFAEHNRYCTTFAECGWTPPSSSPYLFYLSRDEVAVGGAVADPALLRLRIEADLAEAKLVPQVTQDRFLAVAAGDPDGDGTLEVWIASSAGEVQPLGGGVP